MITVDDVARRARGFSVGIDLDLTLINTREATAYALARVNDALGVDIDVEAFVGRLGPPIRQELRRWVEESLLDEAVKVFRQVFTTEGQAYLELMPGARELVHAILNHGGRVVLITSRRQEIALRCLESVGISVDAVVGGVTGAEKAPSMRAENVCAYLGDHVLDMEAAREARVAAVGVTTGSHDARDLIDAGADCVVDSLVLLARAIRQDQGR
jgi:phosphoglycolate phosphatase